MNRELLAEAELALANLKDFQRETVDHVHRHLFDPKGSRRFLVADEVGLGKTLVARGVVARAIQALHKDVERIDVVYICSNSDIAKQNINRLRIGKDRIALDTRLTLLPKHVNQLKHSKERLNFVAFTPSTSFDLKEGLGRVDERALVYLMLRELWDLGDRAAPLNVFKGTAGIDGFRNAVAAESLDSIDPNLESTHGFQKQLAGREKALRAEFEELCAAYPQARSEPGGEISVRRSRFVGELRASLAASCLRSLEPDVVILDEFQRFSHLLDAHNEEAELAQQLFSFNDVRVLLLSATPYRMYTPPGEASADDHYADFVRTVDFLERNAPGAEGVRPLLGEYREAMLEVGVTGSAERLRAAARKLEERLRTVIVRTERLGATEDRNGMLREIHSGTAAVTTDDALGYVAMSRIAKAIDHHDPVEYWKSAPYVLNFMEKQDYALTKGLEFARNEPSKRVEIAKALAAAGNHRFDIQELAAQRPIDPGNGRLRQLAEQTVGKGAHRLLWLPPAMPYYGLQGAFGAPEVEKLTKRLVFTSWRFVPRAIAGFLSYEAERLMMGETRRRRSGQGLLRFSTDGGRPAGMPVLAMMYPSSFLARACDPLALARELATTGRPDALAVTQLAIERIDIALLRVKAGSQDGSVDQRWYWAAPLLLDMALEPEATQSWLNRDDLESSWAGLEDGEEVDSGWAAHVETARALALNGGRDLGKRPDDLAEVLAELGLGGPGPCLLRSMLRVVGLKTDALSGDVGLAIRTSAAGAAWAFRTLYNQPEVTALLQREAGSGLEDEGFWRVALRYGVQGCLQAVLDEYAHVLRDHLGLVGGAGDEKVHEIAEHMRQALSLRTANLAVRDLRASESGLTFEEGESHRLRCHFAVRFGDQFDDGGTLATRADLVRRAFNSPFWPFVLATTSVGQEGLDFHPYCHAVVHWNLPTNPVDLEQREGRVHRYKGHAVRKNVAQQYAGEVIAGETPDAWEELFKLAHARRPRGSADIVPYWVFAPEGGARIERHVLALPSSREHEQVHRLLRSLTLYRMVFGQPRQEDMLRFLTERVPAEELHELLAATQIRLSPDHQSSTP